MHRIVQTSKENLLWDQFMKDIPMYHSVNRYIDILIHFSTDLVCARLIDMGIIRNVENEPAVLKWQSSQGFMDEHKSNTFFTKDEGKNIGHELCMSLQGSESLRIDVLTLKYLTDLEGMRTGKFKWRKVHAVLDDLADQIAGAMDRIMVMRNIMQSNGCSFDAFSSSHSTGGGIGINFYTSYGGHFYDKNAEEPCPYHVHASVRKALEGT